MAAPADIHAVPKRPEFLQGFFGIVFGHQKKHGSFCHRYPKQPFRNGCFNWMIPNLYVENGCFTKHPFINGCLGFQVVEWLFLVPVKGGR